MGSDYEFTLRQEVLMEKGAGILGDLFRIERRQGIKEENHPINVLYNLVWSAKQDILDAESYTQLDHIEGKFELADTFIQQLGL